MLDLFGREVKRGDIIAYGKSGSNNFIKYADTSLGIVNNILPQTVYNKDTSMYKKIFKDYLKVPQNLPNLPDSVTVNAKITFYPFALHDYNIGLQPTRKNGKPKKNVVISTNFLIINKSDLNEDWLQVYDNVCKAFKI